MRNCELSADRNQFAVEIYLPEGSGLEETKKITYELTGILEKEEKVTGVTSFIGCSSPRFHMSYAPVIAGKNFAQLIVNTESIEASLELLDKLAPVYSNHWPGAYVRWKQMDYLPVLIISFVVIACDVISVFIAVNSECHIASRVACGIGSKH